MDDCVHQLIFFLSKIFSYAHVESASFAMLAHLSTIFVLATLVLMHLKFVLSANRHTKQKKKTCQSEDLVG